MSDASDAERSLGDEDAGLVSALASGDRRALADLYDRHAPWMLGQAHHILGNRRDAEDLVHDVFLEVWRKAASYQPERAGVRTWLRVKLRSRAVDRIRSRELARRHGVRRLLEDDDPVDPDSASDLLRCVDRGRALEALASLPESQRRVIEMSYLEGVAAGEIARRCGLPLGTVKSRMSRGLALLRERLALPEEIES